MDGAGHFAVLEEMHQRINQAGDAQGHGPPHHPAQAVENAAAKQNFFQYRHDCRRAQGADKDAGYPGGAKGMNQGPTAQRDGQQGHHPQGDETGGKSAQQFAALPGGRNQPKILPRVHPEDSQQGPKQGQGQNQARSMNR